MKDNRQAINTVGSPLAPKDKTGRGGYAIPLLYGAGMAALRFLPAAYRGFRAARAYTPMSKNLGTMGRLKDIFTPKGGLSAPMAPTGAGAGFRVGSFLRQNPITTASLVPQTATLAGKGVVEGVKAIPDLAKGYIEAVLPGQQFGEEDQIQTTEDTGGIKRGSKSKVVSTPNTSGQTGDGEKQGITEDRVNEAKQKYYKLMGIDKMNKEAVYDSLIDASKIISQEGADLKGSIKSGSLQNQIISAISKNLDKSSDLKKKIDAAVLQGEIQKDINKTKLSSFQDHIKFIRENPDDPLAKKLSGATSVADNLAALAGKSPITSDMVQRIIEAKGVGVEARVPDDKYQKWEKKNENRDEIDYLQDTYPGQKIDAGIYVINKKAIQIDKDGNATFVDLDSILG
jgi:hypothetical protein